MVAYASRVASGRFARGGGEQKGREVQCAAPLKPGTRMGDAWGRMHGEMCGEN